MESEPFYVMTPREIVTGAVFGVSDLPVRHDDTGGDPRAVLEDVVRRALQRPPCAVAFSGGRDSSLVLAVAVAVARRDGLPEPIAVTRVFPGIEEADERSWQEAVIAHLGVREWQRIVLHDELDLVGPLATAQLREHGVLWPPAILSDTPLVDVVPGGTLLDGEGGDEVLGAGSHRIAPLANVVRSPRRNARFAPRAAQSVLPLPLRSRLHRRALLAAQARPWLRPDVLAAFVDDAVTSLEDRPLAYADSVRLMPRRRAQVLGHRNRRLLAMRRDVAITSPLLDPEFVDALARFGGRLGPGTRTATLRALASDLLPDAVIGRMSKALFNRCYNAGPSRAFAASWSGAGVDPELVDADELRRAWLAPEPPAPTSALLQAAWLAEQAPM